jgi:mono/diheme cytochrome c family protein
MRAFVAVVGALVAASTPAFIGACRPSVATTPDPAIIAMQERGRTLFFGRAGCATCHRIGEEGTQIVGPNLGVGDQQTVPVGARTRHDGLKGLDYVVESIVDPDAFVVPGYARGVMKRYEEPPISLTDDEILSLATFLASQGSGVEGIDTSEVTRARPRMATFRTVRAARSAASAR